MNNSQLINQTSGAVEYYTPAKIVEAARAILGTIDLDPASCAEANKTVKACCYFTKEQNGLTEKWHGRVWLNHPFTRAHNAEWIKKLIREYSECRVVAACCITFASTSESWFRPLLDYPQCYLFPRTNYYLPDGTLRRGVSKGSVVTYLGPHTDSFVRIFESRNLGKVKV